MLAFLVRLLFVVLLARLFVAVFRLLQGPRRARRRPEPKKKPAGIPPHVGAGIEDAEFEELRQEREP